MVIQLKNVLYLDYFFPPLEADWRGIAFAKYLPEFGWKPIVISADESVSYWKDYSLLKEVPENLEIIRVPHREPSKSWRALKRKLKMNADFPDYYKDWYHPAYSEARTILLRQKIDLIYSASPTFTTAFVAMQLKKEFNIPWVADFLDGWAVNDFFSKECDETLAQPLRWFHKLRVQRAERRILQSADRTVVISWHVKQRLCELHGVDEDRINVVTDGYDETAFSQLTSVDMFGDRLTIVFLGSFYRHFSEPIRTFLNVVKELDGNAEIVFVGRAAIPVHTLHAGNVTCILNVPRSKALSFGLGSDFLLVVMPGFAKWIPTKIYDYLRLGKPILALVPEDGDAAKIVREAKAGYVLSYDAGEMIQQLKAILEQWKRGDLKHFHPDVDYVKQFERRKLTQTIVDVFNTVAV